MSLTEINASIGSNNANSYVTLEECDYYLSKRDGFDITEWSALSDEQKSFRIIYGAAIIDSLKFSGKKALKTQSMKFPRIFSKDALFDAAGKFSTWEDLEDYCELMDFSVPIIPEKVKFAQIETTFQVVHSYLMTIEPFESGETDIASLSIDVISLSFSKNQRSPYSLFSKADFGADSSIKLLLQDYLSTFRGELV